jgi:hypothetical protein
MASPRSAHPADSGVAWAELYIIQGNGSIIVQGVQGAENAMPTAMIDIKRQLRSYDISSHQICDIQYTIIFHTVPK